MRTNLPSRSWLCSLVVTGLGLLTLALPISRTHAAGLLVADGGFGGKLEITEQDVQVTINNGIAVTRIDQVFLNTENRIVEALYTFPVPNGASVSNFSMVIDGKEMIGEVVEKQRARQIYDSYKTQKRDPGLLEQVDYKAFELRVFPIAAGAEQHISITYNQQLDFDHNTATYVYPLATTTKGELDSMTRGKFAVTIDVKSEIPILKLYSPSHTNDFVVTSFTSKYTRASLEVTEGDLNRDVVITYDAERARTGIDVVTSKQADEDGYFMLSMTAGKELEEFGSGMDYVFVVDVSGSMANDGKLQLSRKAVGSFVDALGTEDRFDVMTFNNTPNLQYDKLQPVTQANQKASRDFLISQRAAGGTALQPAVLTAYKFKDADRPLNVVILSDGMTDIQEQSELLSVMKAAPAGTRVFCIGIGNDINRPLLKQVAESTGGLAAFISHQDDFARQAQAFRRKLMRPVATDVRLQIEGAEVYDLASDQLPDLYYGAPITMIGRYKKSGSVNVTVSGEVLGQPLQETITLDFPATNDRNPEIERMWAFARVQRLMDQMRESGNDPQAINEIVRLCEGYSIVSEYASFIVLENDAEYSRWSIQRRNATRTTRDRKALANIREELERLRNESLAKLGPQTTTLVSTNDTESNTSETTSRQPISQSQPPTTKSRPGDLNIKTSVGGGGGGAIDPITGFIAAGFVGASTFAARRRKNFK